MSAVTMRFEVLSEKYGFIFLLVSLVALLIIPPHWQAQYGGVVTSVLVTAIMLSFLIFVAAKKTELLVGVVLAIPVTIYNWSDVLRGDDVPLAGLIGLNILFYGFIVLELVRYIMTSKQVNFNLMAASICVYFIFGVLFSHIYFVIELLSPGALLAPSVAAADVFSQLMYFSFVTMTTLGYGDITPSTQVAQHWVVLQAIIGQFYLAIVIARLMALYKPR